MILTGLSLAKKAALDAATLADIQGFFSLLDFPDKRFEKRFSGPPNRLVAGLLVS